MYNKRKYSKKNIALLEPYIPGFQPEKGTKYIKLNTNENAYPPSENVIKELKNAIDETLSLYPSSTSKELRNTISKQYGVAFDEILCTNGSDESIGMVFKTFLEFDDVVLFSYPTYSYYKSQADIYNIKYKYIDTDSNFNIDLDKFLEYPSKITFIANPNAPTGKILRANEIESFIKYYDGLLIVDEAYIDFVGSDESVYRLINDYNNILVLRTFSKSFSLCGIRVGYVFGEKSLISSMNKTKDSYNVSYLSQIAANAAMEDYSYMLKNSEKIKEIREYVKSSLKKLDFEIVPSSTNFLFIKHKNIMAKYIFEKLCEKNIFVRYFNDRRVSEYLRVTIGKESDMKVFLESIEEIIKNSTLSSIV